MAHSSSQTNSRNVLPKKLRQQTIDFLNRKIVLLIKQLKEKKALKIVFNYQNRKTF